MKINQTRAYENFVLEKVEHQEKKKKAYSTLPYKWTYQPHSYLLLETHFLVDHHKQNKRYAFRLTKSAVYSYHNLIKGPSLSLKVPP